MLYYSTGTLRYSTRSYTLIMDVDQPLMDYYRKLIPKWHDYAESNRPMYNAHVSVIRKELPRNLHKWGKYQGDSINFYYDGIIYGGEIYRWINVYSNQLEHIRMELDLPIIEEYIQPPKGFSKTFHITLGNIK